MRYFALTLVLSFSFLSQAQYFDGNTTEFKNVNILCQSSGALIAISEQDKTYWQSDAGQTSGLQFTVTSWKTARCPHCFEAEGFYEVAPGVVIKTALSANYEFYSKKMSLTYYVFDEDGNKEVGISPEEFNCLVK